MPIHRFRQSLINKIAAGEVIERPASVVKELMENAVDAGATRIDVSVAAGRAGADPRGRQRLRHPGRASCRWPWPAMPPARSPTADDLFRVGTLGFRGEALASIAEVSRLVLRSRTRRESRRRGD